MGIIIRYPDAQRVEMLALFVGRNIIRAIPRNGADTVELTRTEGQWTDGHGVPVELEAMVVPAGVDLGGILEAPQAYAAAS